MTYLEKLTQKVIEDGGEDDPLYMAFDGCPEYYFDVVIESCPEGPCKCARCWLQEVKEDDA